MFNLRESEEIVEREKYTDDAESFLSDGSSVPGLERKQNISFTRFIGILICNSLLVAILSALLTKLWMGDLDGVCVRLASSYSPLLREVDVTHTKVRYNGSFFHEKIYRRDASPEVDEAWQALGIDYRPVRILNSEAERSGIALDQVKIREKYGGGYPANVEGLHHLHCLNLLRQGLHYNYDYYKSLGQGAFKNEEPIVKVHITHCLDIIRQQLMCTVDTGVLGQIWWNVESPKPFVDFNTKHTCKNYDAVRKWAEERQLPEKTPNDFLETPKPGDKIYAEIP